MRIRSSEGNLLKRQSFWAISCEYWRYKGVSSPQQGKFIGFTLLWVRLLRRLFGLNGVAVVYSPTPADRDSWLPWCWWWVDFISTPVCWREWYCWCKSHHLPPISPSHTLRILLYCVVLGNFIVSSGAAEELIWSCAAHQRQQQERRVLLFISFSGGFVKFCHGWRREDRRRSWWR